LQRARGRVDEELILDLNDGDEISIFRSRMSLIKMAASSSRERYTVMYAQWVEWAKYCKNSNT
jgi:hypothetical protein